MGHIELAAPVVHIWFFKAMPSRLGALLDMKTSSLEKVIYFQDYVVLDPKDTPLKKQQLLTEEEFREARGDLRRRRFEAEMGAEAVRKLLLGLDLVHALEGAPRGTAHDGLEAEEEGSRQPAQDRREHPRQREQAGVDGPRRDPGDPARSAAARDARQRQFRHERPERPLSPDHQPQQPAQEARRPQRPRGDHPQREADAAAVGRRAVRQQPLQAAGARLEQPPAQEPHRHDQGQAGPVPREPARQARRLLGPLA